MKVCEDCRALEERRYTLWLQLTSLVRLVCADRTRKVNSAQQTADAMSEYPGLDRVFVAFAEFEQS